MFFYKIPLSSSEGSTFSYFYKLFNLKMLLGLFLLHPHVSWQPELYFFPTVNNFVRGGDQVWLWTTINTKNMLIIGIVKVSLVSFSSAFKHLLWSQNWLISTFKSYTWNVRLEENSEEWGEVRNEHMFITSNVLSLSV